MVYLLLIFSFLSIPSYAQESTNQISWNVKELVKGGRIDAIADLGDGVVIAGSRSPNPGMIFRSDDYGLTWRKVKTLNIPKGTYRHNQILCLMKGTANYAYLITGNAQFWRSTDKGLTWKRMASLGGKLGKRSFSYSICVTPSGTLLVTNGYFIYRSTDNGLHFKKIGPITDHYLYRLQLVGHDTIFANGWGGTLYRSIDDGKTWKSFAKLGPATIPGSSKDPMKSQPYLTAMEYLGGDILLQGTMGGENYRVNQYNPNRIKKVAKVDGSLDDYVYLGYGTIIASTFLRKKALYISYNGGESWKNIGNVPTGVKGDWLDHVIRLKRNDSVIAIGGTHKGFIARAAFSCDRLYQKSHLHHFND